MKVVLSTAPDTDDVRLFNVPAEYRTKADAKTAVTLSAVMQGVVELLRFRGQPIPPGYKPFPRSFEEEAAGEPVSKKRREPEPDEQQEPHTLRHKKRKMNHLKQKQGNLSSVHPDDSNETSVVRPDPHAKPHPPHNGHHKRGNDNRPWKKPHVPGSGGLESLSDVANTTHPMDQSRSGPSYEGGSNQPSQGPPHARLAHAHAHVPSNPPPPGGPPSHASSAQTHSAASAHGGGQASSAVRPSEHLRATSLRGGGHTAQMPSALPYPTSHYAGLQTASTSASRYAQPSAGYPGQSVSEPYFAAKTTQHPFPSVRGPESYPQHSAAGYAGGSRSVKAAPRSHPLSHDQAPSYQNASRPSYDSHSDGGPGSARRGVGSSTPSSYHSSGLDNKQDIGESSRVGQQKNDPYHGQSRSSDARSRGDPELGTGSSRKNMDMPEHTGSSRVMGECLVDG